MLLAGYLIGLILVFLIVKRRDKSMRSIIIIAYNYLFSVGILLVSGLTSKPFSWRETAMYLIKSIYSSPPAMSFRRNINEVHGLQEMIIFSLMSVYTLRTAFVLFFKKTSNLIRMSIRLIVRKEVYIVWGNAADASLLIKDIHKKVPCAAVVWIAFTGGSTAEYAALPTDESFFQRLKRKKRYYVILLNDDTGGNLGRLKTLSEIKRDSNQLIVNALLDDDCIRLNDPDYPNMDLCCLSVEDLQFNQFCAEHLPIHELSARVPYSIEEGILVPARPFRLVLVGFEESARAFLLHFCENTAFETLSNKACGLEVKIFGAGNAEWDSFFEDYSSLTDYVQISRQFEPAEVGPGNMLTASDTMPDCIAVFTSSTKKNIDIAQRILRKLHKLGLSRDKYPLLVLSSIGIDESSLAQFKDAAEICVLPRKQSFCTYHALIERFYDQPAVAFHNRYRENHEGTLDWGKIGAFMQSSNRAVARDIETKRALAKDLCTDRVSAIWKLAQYEHRRWMLFHVAHGWTPLPAEELTEAERSACISKRVSEKRHTCLIDWDQLDTLPQSPPGIYKKYDFLNVEETINWMDMPTKNTACIHKSKKKP